jgi:RNA polymerase sigma-70 factor (ECF subfamily)
MQMDELIARILAGDREAFAAIVEEMQARVRAYVACRLSDPETAEDLAQETFIVAYRRLKDFDASQEFWPWLRGIAHNLVLNERRKLSREEALREELLWQDAGGPRESPGVRPGALEALARCLSRLSERMREFVRLRYDESRPLEEIAGQLGLTGGSARVAHVKVLRALRDCMTRQAPGGDGAR